MVKHSYNIYIYINVHYLITLLILRIKTPTRVQMIHHTSKYFGTNYQSLKICFFKSLRLCRASAMKIFDVDDWQDDAHSSLYTHFWCSYTRTSSLVVNSLAMTLTTWVQFLRGSIFWNFKFQTLWYFHVFLSIYTHIWTEIITTTVV